MNETEKSAKRTITDLVQKLSQNGYQVSEPLKEGYAYSIKTVKNAEFIKILVYFGRNGVKTLIQGNSENRLYNSIKTMIFGDELFKNLDSNVAEPNQYIGIDESGKGDYFGPLVVAAAFVTENEKTQLKNLGVRDSKLLSDVSINKISNQIKKILSERFEIVIINPEKYNQLYEKFGNLNRLLAWAHSRVLENLIKKTNATIAISDKFGNENLIRNVLMEKGNQINFYQYTKAERYTAVAAASILAREKVLNWFDKNSKELKIKLPKGASSSVNDIAAGLREKLDEAEFKKLVKFHFKNSVSQKN